MTGRGWIISILKQNELQCAEKVPNYPRGNKFKVGQSAGKVMAFLFLSTGSSTLNVCIANAYWDMVGRLCEAVRRTITATVWRGNFWIIRSFEPLLILNFAAYMAWSLLLVRLKFAAYMDFSFITLFHILLVPFFIIVYVVVCFCLIL